MGGDQARACGGYNPVVIVGPAGSGKSRLLSEWFVQHSHAAPPGQPAAVMWDGRSLLRELTVALSQNTIDRLHDRFVTSRLIIIDSVEQITAWDAQRALAHLFDAATAVGAVFVATLRVHPIACPGLEPSLASRLSGGLVVAMPPVGGTRYDGEGDGLSRRQSPSLRRVIGATARPACLAGPGATPPGLQNPHTPRARFGTKPVLWARAPAATIMFDGAPPDAGRHADRPR